MLFCESIKIFLAVCFFNYLCISPPFMVPHNQGSIVFLQFWNVKAYFIMYAVPVFKFSNSGNEILLLFFFSAVKEYESYKIWFIWTAAEYSEAGCSWERDSQWWLWRCNPDGCTGSCTWVVLISQKRGSVLNFTLCGHVSYVAVLPWSCFASCYI